MKNHGGFSSHLKEQHHQLNNHKQLNRKRRTELIIQNFILKEAIRNPREKTKKMR